MPEAEFCPACGARFGLGARSCADCGEPRPRSDDAADREHPGPPPEGPGPGRQTPQSGEPPPDDAGEGGPPPGEPAGEHEFPTPSAEIPPRAASALLNYVVVGALAPPLGLVAIPLWIIVNAFLFQRGKDVGALIFRMRIVRDTGELAGFYHMAARYLAAIISLLALGAGYWTALSDPHLRTWHDKMLGTYVVRDGPEYRALPGTSSENARRWFWIAFLLLGVTPFLLYLLALAASTSVPAGAAQGFPQPQPIVF